MEPEGGWSEHDVTSLSAEQHQQHHHESDEAAGHQRHRQRGDTAGDILKPLVRRRLQHQRDLAHSLVGTPNYIAPEVLAGTGQFTLCLSVRLSVCVLLCGDLNNLGTDS